MRKKPMGQQNRKPWFKRFRKLMLGRYKRPEFVYLGKPFDKSAIIVSNHEGTDAPMSFELYCDAPLRFWGASEMNSGLVSLYKYQTRVYYHQRKHWNLHLARLFCLIASPLTNLFYKGLNLISTYRDIRFTKTIKESIKALDGGENIVIFPEDASEGYKEQLDGFFPGFVMLAEVCYRRGRDLPIYVTYFRKKELVFVVDAPVYYSELARGGAGREEIAEKLLKRCNELAYIDLDGARNEGKNEAKAELAMRAHA